MRTIKSINPISAVAGLFREEKGVEEPSFLGTCFSFRQPTHFLTAAHCIGNLSESEIMIAHPKDDETYPAQTVVKHPTADIAVVVINPTQSSSIESFYRFRDDYSMGSSFNAFGFPESIFDEDSRKPTARFFKGYFQRFMFYRSHLGFVYEAGELNIACPAGLSGGPIYRPDIPLIVYGLVTENMESTTFLHSVEEIQEDGSIVRERYQNVINYGVCLMLSGVEDWLNAHVPKP